METPKYRFLCVTEDWDRSRGFPTLQKALEYCHIVFTIGILDLETHETYKGLPDVSELFEVPLNVNENNMTRFLCVPEDWDESRGFPTLQEALKYCHSVFIIGILDLETHETYDGVPDVSELFEVPL